MGHRPNTPPERIRDRRVRQEERDDAHKLTTLGGIAALSLDALSSVAYGPEAIVLALVAAGAAAVREVGVGGDRHPAARSGAVLPPGDRGLPRTGVARTRWRRRTWDRGQACLQQRASSSTTC